MSLDLEPVAPGRRPRVPARSRRALALDVRGSVPFIALEHDAVTAWLPAARRWLREFAAEHGASPALLRDVDAAVTEAITNAVVHAYPPGRPGRVQIQADVEDGVLEVVVLDEGVGLGPSATTGLGLGLRLMRRRAAGFAIADRREGGVEVWLRFVLTESGHTRR